MTRRDLFSTAIAGLAASELCRGAAEESELIGKPAPALALADWINSPRKDMSDLRGQVVLLRWWTEGCPFCAATAPALLDLQSAYGPKGLQVIGVFHPKPPGSGNRRQVEKAVRDKAFTFPVAIDWNWTALNRWWLFKDRDFTSVSFLVDRQGMIRYIHPGGEFHAGEQGGMPSHASCQRDLVTIKRKIETLIRA